MLGTGKPSASHAGPFELEFFLPLLFLPQLLQSCWDSQTGRQQAMCPLLLQKLQRLQS